jgi:hypothetical protein
MTTRTKQIKNALPTISQPFSAEAEMVLQDVQIALTEASYLPAIEQIRLLTALQLQLSGQVAALLPAAIAQAEAIGLAK